MGDSHACCPVLLPVRGLRDTTVYEVNLHPCPKTVKLADVGNRFASHIGPARLFSKLVRISMVDLNYRCNDHISQISMLCLLTAITKTMEPLSSMLSILIEVVFGW